MGKMKKARNIVLICFLLMGAGMFHSENAYAEKVGKYELSDTSPNCEYDVTGDGVKDTVEIKKMNESSYGSGYCGFKVIINGKTALTDNTSWYYGLETIFIQTKGHGYFLISLGHDNGDGPKIIYEYVNGQLKKRVDLGKVAGKIFYHYSVTVSSIKDSSIKLKVIGQTNMLAYTETTFDYNVGAKGKLSLAKKIVKVSYSDQRYNSKTDQFETSKYLIAVKKIPVYRSATGTKKAFHIKKGTKLTIKKVSMKGKCRYYCITKSGKKGWIKNKYGCFQGLMYAG